jgi:hypothetical protein
MKRWEGAATPSLNPPQIVFNITASCNKITIRVRTLIISSIKSSVKGALHWASNGRTRWKRESYKSIHHLKALRIQVEARFVSF